MKSIISFCSFLWLLPLWCEADSSFSEQACQTEIQLYCQSQQNLNDNSNTQDAIDQEGQKNFQDLQNVLNQAASQQAVSKVVQSLGVQIGENIDSNAQCLWQKLKQNKMNGLSSPFSADCETGVRNYFVNRYSSIQSDQELLITCAIDIEARCNQVKLGEGRILGCLKAHKKALMPECRLLITSRQIEAAEDLRLDPELRTACMDDYNNHCDLIPTMHGNGQAVFCLLDLQDDEDNFANTISPLCRVQIHKRRVLDSEQVEFNYRIWSNCRGDLERFCGQNGKEWKGGEALVCLEENMYDSKFSSQCKQELHRNALTRSRDLRLDYTIQTQCQHHVQQLCPEKLKWLEEPFASVEAPEDLFECLREHRTRLVGACSDRVHQLMTMSFHEQELDRGLVLHCTREISEGPCRLVDDKLVCLSTQVREGGELSRTCFTFVVNRISQRMSDIHFNHELVSACTDEQQRYCGLVKHGEGSVIHCLQEHLGFMEMGRSCRKELHKLLSMSAYDLNLVLSLKMACGATIEELCGGVEIGEGRLVRCVMQKRGQITDGGCRAEVLKVFGLTADGFRLEHKLEKECRQDLNVFCPKAQSGDGAIINCVIKHADELSPECYRVHELVAVVKNKEIRASQRITEMCEGALDIFCRDKIETPRLALQCLLDNRNSQHFPNDCREMMGSLQQQNKNDDVDEDLKLACAKDVSSFCLETISWSKNAKQQEDTVQCLIRSENLLSNQCRKLLVKTSRQKLRNYMPQIPLTQVCDKDLINACQVSAEIVPYLSKGSAFKCLADHAPQISSGCFTLLTFMEDWEITFGGLLEVYWGAKVSESTLRQVAQQLTQEIPYEKVHHMERELRNQVANDGIPGIAFFLLVGLLFVASAVLFPRLKQYRKQYKLKV